MTDNPQTREDVLLPCPFCGGSARTLTRLTTVFCDSPHCGASQRCDTQEYAITAWNTRHSALSTDALRKAAQDLLDQINEEGPPAKEWQAIGAAMDRLSAALSTKAPLSMEGLEGLREALGNLDCTMVEVCEPHPGNPSPNIIAVERAKLIRALS